MSLGRRNAAGPVDDVIVVGGGVIGMSIAETLSREGIRVRVLEAQGVASGASGAAAGMLAPLSEAAEGGPLLRLGLESLRLFESLCARLIDETGIDPELEASGLYRVARSEAGCLELEARRALLNRECAGLASLEGAALEWVEGRSLRDLEPALSADVQAALHSPLECHLRPPLFARALEAAARARGVTVELGVRATSLKRAGGRVVGVETDAGGWVADSVVVAAGPWSAELLESSAVAPSASDRLAVEPVRGQILSLEAPVPSIGSIVWDEEVYFVPKRDGSWVIGATQESVGFDRRVTAEGIRWLLDRATAVFPSLANASFGRAWAGLRPVSQDGVPWIGRMPGFDNLYLATGHGRNGVLLAPVTAELIRDDLLGKGGVLPSDPISPWRGFSP